MAAAPQPAAAGSTPIAMAHGRIIVGYGPHRPEILAFLEPIAFAAAAVMLEEPPNPAFAAMLCGDRSIEDYLPETGTEYPEFTRRSCEMYRRLARRGKTLFQIDPYLAVLERLQWRLEAGASPEDLNRNADEAAVYRAEHEATGALLEFYRLSVSSSFDRIVDAVLRFAAKDAHRIDLRDRMRADAIAAEAQRFQSVFVEAGEVHLGLSVHLRRLLPKGVRIDSRLLLGPAARRQFGKPLRLSPGDLLTHRLRRGAELNDDRHRLWAARSLIANKIQNKIEMDDGAAGGMPHLADDLAVASAIGRLSYTACRKIFEQIRSQSSSTARRSVWEHLSRADRPDARYSNGGSQVTAKP